MFYTNRNTKLIKEKLKSFSLDIRIFKCYILVKLLFLLIHEWDKDLKL